MKKIIVLTVVLLALIALLCFSTHATEGVADAPSAETSTALSEDNVSEDSTVAQSVANWLWGYFDEIVSATTGAAFVWLACAFKKRLLPLVADAIQQVAKRSESAEKNFSEGVKTAVDKLERCGKFLDDYSQKLDAMAEDMIKKQAAQNKAYKLQTDLINYLVVNLRIPNDLKMEIAERSAAVEKALEEAGGAE